MAERLQKILSQWGVASRRQAEQLIIAGRVSLNGKTAELGQRADPSHDRIEVDGQLLSTSNPLDRRYFLLHKPPGVISTCQDPQGRSTVLDLLPVHLRDGVYPVGRLDANSTGALLMTSDGSLTHALTHPRHCVAKTYEVWVTGQPDVKILQQWRAGVILSGRKTLPAQVNVLQRTPTQTLLEITLREGRNRQIRRVAEQLGHPVRSLHRVAIGSIVLGQLELGGYRSLNSAELSYLRSLIDPSTVSPYARPLPIN